MHQSFVTMISPPTGEDSWEMCRVFLHFLLPRRRQNSGDKNNTVLWGQIGEVFRGPSSNHDLVTSCISFVEFWSWNNFYGHFLPGERGGSVVECRTPEREVRGSRPTAAVLCPWARHFTPRKYWLITQEAMAPSRHDWKIVDWDVKPQHNHFLPTADSSKAVVMLLAKIWALSPCACPGTVWIG